MFDIFGKSPGKDAKDMDPDDVVAVVEKRGAKLAREQMLNGLCKVASQLDNKLLPPKYRAAIYSAIINYNPDVSPYLETIRDQVAAQKSPGDLEAWQYVQIERWVMENPEFLFSLMIGLASGNGDEFAWAIAYA